MYYTVCQKTNKHPFDRDIWNKTPATLMGLETIKSHEKCNAHKDAARKHADVGRCVTITENIQPEICLSSMAKTFACAYFLCKNRIAHRTNFGPLVDFIDFLGVKLSKICIGMNATYHSDKSIQEMLYAMSNLIEDRILDDFKNQISLLLCLIRRQMIVVLEQLVIRTRFIDSDGVLKVKFLKMLDALNTAVDEDPTYNQIISRNGTNIANQVKDFVLSKQLMFLKLVGIRTDGAPVMTGKHNGAVKQIVDFQKDAQTNSDPGRKCEAVGVHCAAHRLRLAASQEGDGVPYVRKFKDHLRKLR